MREKNRATILEAGSQMERWLTVTSSATEKAESETHIKSSRSNHA